MLGIAQTNVQLYNQIRRQQYSEEDLNLIRQAYDFARNLYSGCFQADGTPFVAHITGVASIVANLELASDYVAAACLHNVYTNGDFGDGRRRCATNHRRRLVTDTLGEQVEAHIFRFYTWLRGTSKATLKIADQVGTLDQQDRMLLVVDLADMLEKCHALGPLYYGDHEWITDVVERDGARFVDLAEQLGYPQLASALSDAFDALLAESIPDSLRSVNTRQQYMQLDIPRSCTLRPAIKVRRGFRRFRRRARRVLSTG